jgi:acylphosphatase
VVAEGERQALEQLLEYLREGPRAARVDEVEVHWGQPSGGYPDFAIAL